MSTTDAELEVPQSPAMLSAGPGTGDLALTSAREARLGDVTVRRLLPLRQRRSVGAWCFVDHYGPMSVDGVAGMRVPPHPHIGPQTVTWLISGNLLHRDSLGSEQMIRPGQLNLMTSGRGIAHSEESPAEHDPELHGGPLGEPLLMWWNFVARTPEEIAAAAGEWARGRFGTVNGYDGEPLAAPRLDAARLTRHW